MKVTISSSSKTLISDIIVQPRVQNVYRNRRGNIMDFSETITPLSDTSKRSEAEVSAEVDKNPLTAKSIVSTIFAMSAQLLVTIHTRVPSWSPKKFTVEDGVKTNWKAALPSKNMLTTSGVMAALLVVAGATVWALPMGNIPVELPPRTATPSQAQPQQPTSNVLTATKEVNVVSDTAVTRSAQYGTTAPVSNTPQSSNAIPPLTIPDTTSPITSKPEPEVIIPPAVTEPEEQPAQPPVEETLPTPTPTDPLISTPEVPSN